MFPVKMNHKFHQTHTAQIKLELDIGCQIFYPKSKVKTNTEM